MQNHTTMKTILASRVKEEVNDWLSTGKRLIPILFLLLFGVGNVWGDTNINFSGGYIYFADTYNVHKGSTQLCGRKSNCSNGEWYTAVTTLNNIGHTKLYYTNSLEGSGWSNVCWAGWALISNSSAKSNADTEYWKGTNSTWYSNFDTYGLNSGSTYLITVASASKGATKTTSYLGNSNTQYTSFNHSQTVYKYTSTNGGSTYSAASINSGTVTISAYKMTGNGTASNSSNSATINTASTTSASKDAAYTGEVTLTASANTGYTFVGWFETASGGSALSTSSEYTYNAPNSTKSIYARFVAEETHDVTVYYKYGSTTVKAYTTESAVGVTTERTFTAPEIDGYNFYSYTFGDGLTMKSANTTTNPCRFVTKASGNYELTTNYSIAPVKLLYGTSTPLNSPSNTAMTYDAVAKAYYIDVTTSASPYYFRFDFNNNTQEYAGAWNTYPDVNAVAANGAKVTCATEVKGWENKSSLKFTGLSGSSIRIWFSYKDKKAWITEATYTVTITNDGNGTTSPASVTAGKNTLSGSFSATANTGYYFKNWTKTSGSVTITNANVSPTTTKATAASAIRANFNPKWQVLGNGEFGGWTAYGSNLFTGYITEGGKDKGYYNITLSANTTYEIQAYDRQASKLYGGTAVQDVYYNTSGFDKPFTLATQSTGKNLYIHTAAGGTYQLEWNLTDKKIAIQYPTSWFITSGQKTEGQDDNAGGSFTALDDSSNDVKGGKFVADNASVMFTATPNTGYNFDGWYTNEACTADKDATNPKTISSIRANQTVYAKFVPKTYTVTLTQTGVASTGTPSVTASYNTTAPAIAALPTAAQGYAFMGYYTAADGEGSQLVAANGTWQNVAGYTSGGKWIRDGGAELFAYFKKGAISALTLDAAIVAQGNTVGITPTLDPVPVGDKVICWRVLHGNGNPLDDQPAFSWNGTKVTFPASTNSGTYLAEAILRKGTTCGGEVLDSVTVSFQVAGDHTVTVQYKCGDVTLQPSTTATGKPLEWTSITAPNIVGYAFSKWKAGDGITIQGADGSGEKATATINFKATYEGKLTAIYTSKRMIYFNNTLGWSGVTVYFYKNASYWNNTYGTGADPTYTFTNTPYSDGKHGNMTQIEGTNIWYYDLDANNVPASLTTVNFTELNQHGYGYFAETGSVKNKVAHPCDDAALFNVNMPMYVPVDNGGEWKNGSKAKYYFKGYWMCYPHYSGYTLKIYNTDNRSTEPTAIKSVDFPYSDGYDLPMSVDVDLEANKTYYFDVYRNDNTLFGNNGDMKYGNSGPWSFFNTDTRRAGIITTAAGKYHFTWSFFNGSSGYKYYMTVNYPVAPNDYRIYYTDNATWSKETHVKNTWYHPSGVITKNADASATKYDTVSFYISKNNSPAMKFQYASSITAGTGKVTWTDVASGTITIPSAVVTAPGIYNFIVKQVGTAKPTIEKVEPYTGDYYIRVDCANSKWDNYTVDPDHRMTYSEYSIDHGGYSHYYCHWVQTDDRKNVKFCIANDYSPSISDTLTREVASGEWANIGSFINAGGDILRNANVRFMWNQSTNKISRAYIDGAQGTGSDNFLKMLSSDSKIKDLSGTPKTEVYFQDNENWIYETNIQAQPNAQYKLESNWGTSPVITQYFKGSSSSTETLITGSGSIWYVIRVIYDFKTNRILAAWMPEGELEEAKDINADVMFIREHQGDINQLILNDEGKISKINTAYGVMRFNKWTINNREKTGSHQPLASPASIYERSLYWVSFPFRVKLSEVFGFGTYGTHWILQYYDGAERAEKGMWAETGSYWKFIWDRKDFILEPNTGYLLALETELMRPESSVWGPGSKANQVELFFPSYGTMPDITQDNVVIPLEEHTCTINRSGGNLPGGNDYRTTYDRRIVDSHWNVMGVPTYVNTDDVTFPASEWTTNLPKFLYTWNADDNTITAASASGFTFHAMHAYMVQYYGNVTWSAHSGSPYPIVARSTYSEKPKEVEFCIELTQNETMLDRTFINLSDDETVSAGFAFNEDMTKEFSDNKPAIYTFIDTDVVAAGNTLPMSDQKTIVPLGVETKQAGDYTIAIPNGTNGVGVTLIDEETGVHTSLSALDYTVSLPAGKHDNRFFLEISPIKTTPTGIEDVQGDNVQSTKVHKVMIDGILYIVKDGKIFDARGARLR